ncbi:MAG: RNA methyltransferase [Bacteroidales bacterium]|nr:RNA methyltransferase [Bacteroidales bacterium]
MRRVEDRKQRGELTRYIEGFVTEERAATLRRVLENRTRHITVVLEDLYQTQNISAVLRTCDCYGIQDVHVLKRRNEFAIHKDISMGADKWLTIREYAHEDYREQVKNCIDGLHDKGYLVAATLPDERRMTFFDIPVGQKVAYMFGTELTGLSEEAKEMADVNVLIPMYGFTESFNISNSAAIILSHTSEKLRKSDVDWRLGDEEAEELYFEWLQKSVRNPDALIRHYLSKS